MAMLLYYGKGDNDAINVGSIFHVFPAFKQVSELIGGEKGYEELESVPGFAEQEVTSWWLKQVAIQGKKFLDTHGENMGDLRWVVEDMVKAIDSYFRQVKPPQVMKT